MDDLSIAYALVAGRWQCIGVGTFAQCVQWTRGPRAVADVLVIVRDMERNAYQMIEARKRPRTFHSGR